MANKAIFPGLVYDEQDNLVENGFIGTESCYIIDDDGFKRHVPSEQIDRKILGIFLEQIHSHRDIAVQQALKMMGTDDLLSKAALDASIDNVNVDQILEQGVPEQARDMMGMMGFRIVVNYRGEVVGFNQPSVTDDEW